MKIESAKNPKYSNAEKNSIDMQVKFEEFTEVLPFTATSYDITLHGKELFNRALNGEFGEIAAYVENQ